MRAKISRNIQTERVGSLLLRGAPFVDHSSLFHPDCSQRLLTRGEAGLSSTCGAITVASRSLSQHRRARIAACLSNIVYWSGGAENFHLLIIPAASTRPTVRPIDLYLSLSLSGNTERTSSSYG